MMNLSKKQQIKEIDWIADVTLSEKEKNEIYKNIKNIKDSVDHNYYYETIEEISSYDNQGPM